LDRDRRRFLRYGLGLAGAGALSLGLADLLDPGIFGSVAPPTNSTSTATTGTSPTSSTNSQYSTLPDYQDFLSWLHSASGKYSGKTLNISLEAEFGPYAAQLRNGDFERASGIKAGPYDIKPYALQLQTVSLMFSTKSSAYDAFSLDVENLGVFPGRSFSPIELAQRYPELTYPNINFDDFNRNCWGHIATYPPDLTGGPGGNTASTVQVIPFDTPTMVLFYRTDVYDQLQLTLPKTWDDHFANVKAINKAGLVSAPFGTVSMAGPDVSIIYEYQAHLSSFGGVLWEFDGRTIIPAMNNDKAIAALENFVRFEPYSDPGSFYFTWDDVFNSISHRSAASGLLWNGYSQWMNDTQRSLVPGLIGYTQNPAGPNGSFHPYAGSGLGVSRYTKNPEMAWLWTQWATAKGTQEAMVLDQYHVFPTRASVMTSPVVASKIGTSAIGVANLTSQVWKANAITTLVGFPLWLQASTILASALNTAWTGAVTPKNALASAQTKLEQIGKLSF
jgi:multiple sugar transport system substrate-binding protein